MEYEPGKALPDWQYVKQELLQSSYNADVYLADYIKGNKRDNSSLMEAIKWIVDLYLKLKPKIDTKKPEYAIIIKLESYITKDVGLKFLDWYGILNALNIKLDDLGVTRIEMPNKKKLNHPLLRGNRPDVS